VRLILITGPPGSGKTSVLTALADALSDDDVPHAAVEVEALAWTHPALDDERRLAHVRTVCAGHALVLLADTAETPGDLAALIAASGADEHSWRGSMRRPTRWPRGSRSVSRELVRHRRARRACARAGGEHVGGPADLVLSTEGARAEDIAARIRQDARL
jgi:energy-coupling factor transporter ATP-binding protein EcfA2